jgi:spore germination protein YaaH
MFEGCLLKGKNVDGYIRNGLLETKSLFRRHKQLVKEMKARGYKHHTPFKNKEFGNLGHVDRKKSLNELLKRCNECRERFTELC